MDDDAACHHAAAAPRRTLPAADCSHRGDVINDQALGLGPVPEWAVAGAVAVAVAVDVIDTVAVGVHVHGNDTVGVIGSP